MGISLTAFKRTDTVMRYIDRSKRAKISRGIKYSLSYVKLIRKNLKSNEARNQAEDASA